MGIAMAGGGGGAIEEGTDGKARDAAANALRRSTPALADLTDGVLAGTLIGTLTTSVAVSCYVVATMFGGIENWETLRNACVALAALLTFAVFGSSFFWFLGIVYVGLPLWWGLHTLGLRGRWIAVACGAFLVGGIFWLTSRMLELTVLGGICGGLAGWAFEGVTYRGWGALKFGRPADQEV